MKKDTPFRWDAESAQEQSVGALLAQENEDGKENALYYLSRRMTPNELNYSPIEKLCLALFEIIYVPQKAVKGQILADFLADHPLPVEWKLCDDFPDEDDMNIEIRPP
ncbi:hypothetical protein LIER_11494 [Lithospermum erythrorhizon]|uniref:Reverse transcriptase RNase H-like domain-containing protein n=1 Tax=Lithospermum erythrorhizon TaxID=34254 RepID=A0AAV3PQ16_LITER